MNFLMFDGIGAFRSVLQMYQTDFSTQPENVWDILQIVDHVLVKVIYKK